MITPEEARNTMMKFEAHDIYNGDFVHELKDMANYITQQEKKDKLLELYRYVWKTPILSQTISLEEAQNRIDELEEELK